MNETENWLQVPIDQGVNNYNTCYDFEITLKGVTTCLHERMLFLFRQKHLRRKKKEK